jgi:site-specific DNA recombinase
MPKPGGKVRPIHGLAELKKKKEIEEPVKPPNALIYTRVSLPRQAKEGFSLANQETTLETYCKENNLNILLKFEEGGESGGTDQRTAFQKMYEYCQKNAANISAVVIYNEKRFFREARLHLNYRELLADLGIRVLSPNYDFKPRPDADEVQTAGAAQRELEQIKENARVSSFDAKNRGKFTGKVPTGFLYERDQNRTRGMIVKHDPVAAPIIAEALRMYVFTNLSRAQIKKWADRQGLVNRYTGKPVSDNAFYKIFANPVYAGIGYDERIGTYELEFKGIVARELFEKSFKKATAGIVRSVSTDKVIRDYPLKGVIRCPGCGKRLSASSPTGKKESYSYYHNQGHEPGCRHKGINIPLVKADPAFEKLLGKLQSGDVLTELMKLVAFDSQEETRKWLKTEKRTLERELELAQDLLDGLLQKYALSKISDNEFNRMKEKEQKRIALIKAELVELGNRNVPLEHLALRAVWALDHLDLPWNMADNDARNSFANALFPDGFRCDKNGNIKLPDQIMHGLLTLKKPQKA